MKAKHTDVGQGHDGCDENYCLKWTSQQFWSSLRACWHISCECYKAVEVWRSNRLLAEQASGNMGIVVNLECTLYFITQSFSVSPPISSTVVMSPSSVCTNGLCPLSLTNVSVAGSPHKDTSSVWKTIQLPLPQQAACCGLDFSFVAWLCGAESCHHMAHSV